MQVLQRRWDRTFSEHSYGFRSGRSAHQAVAQAQYYMAEGYRWVVDLDVEKFFDRVNHDKLMGQVAKRVEDKRLRTEAGDLTHGRKRPHRRHLSVSILSGAVNVPHNLLVPNKRFNSGAVPCAG